MFDFKKFYEAHKAKIKATAFGLLLAVGDALIGLAETGGQHVSLAQAFAVGVGAAWFFLKKLYKEERANLVIEALTGKDAEAK